MWRMLVLAVILVAGCGRQSSAAPGATVQPTATPTLAPTVAPTIPPTPTPDYRKMGQDLLVPLGALIIATRDKSPNATQHLTAFNTVADRVLPTISKDLSVSANVLHSVITNVRDAATRRDVATMERERLNLINLQ